MRKALANFFKRKKFRIRIGEPPFHLYHLLIRKVVGACILFFHFSQYARRIILPLLRPG